MTLEEMSDLLNSPDYKKYEPYMRNIHHFTQDEFNNILEKVPKFKAYMELLGRYMSAWMEDMIKALSCHNSNGPNGGPLQIEALETTIKTITFPNIK